MQVFLGYRSHLRQQYMYEGWENQSRCKNAWSIVDSIVDYLYSIIYPVLVGHTTWILSFNLHNIFRQKYTY